MDWDTTAGRAELTYSFCLHTGNHIPAWTDRVKGDPAFNSDCQDK